MSHAEHFIEKTDKPLGVVRICTICKHSEVVKKGVRGAGRGYGMKVGNQARGKMIQHVKEKHPNELKKYIESLKT